MCENHPEGTYNYQTGELTLNFPYHFMKDGAVCRLNGPGAKIDGHACRNCVYYDGLASDRAQMFQDRKWFVRCKHPDAEHHPESNKLIDDLRSQLYYNALCALDGC